jgi:hypothetical protein
VSQVAIVKAFLRHVTLVPKSGRVTGLAEAYLHLSDDTDDHKYKIAVPADFARYVSKDLSEWEDNEQPLLRIAICPLLHSIHDSERPTMEQLLAVWEASEFIEDYASDTKQCAVCDRCLCTKRDKEHGSTYPHCLASSDCPGAKLRAARHLGEVP